MRRIQLLGGLMLALLVLPADAIQSQGKGQGKEHAQSGKGQGKSQGQAQDKARGPDQKPAQGARGRGADKSRPEVSAQRGRSDVAKATRPGNGKAAGVARGRGVGNDVVSEAGGEVGRWTFRELAESPRHGQRLVGRAVARAAARGNPDDDFIITPLDNRVRVLNRSGAVLLELDDDRDIGIWRSVTEPHRNKSGSPSFCRSGAGHPVWGRQWCIDKGFGLGNDGDIRWTRVIDPGDIMIRRPVSTGVLGRDVLLDVLGDVVLNRLATQAITLGYVEPLSGRWIGESAGPRVLLLSSANRPVAEVVDLNNDDRVDLLVVAARP